MPLLFAPTNDDFLRLTEILHEPLAGGFVSFNGRVRKFNRNKEVAHLFYEAFIPLAKTMFAELESQAKKQFGILQALAIHRLERVDVGQDAVVISVAAIHRNEAFMGARYLIDELKKTLPIWKKEVYIDGSYAFDMGDCSCGNEPDAETITGLNS